MVGWFYFPRKLIPRQNKVVLEELSQSVADAVNQERTAVTHFEKHYKQRHNQILSGLRKAEKDSAKAGKKSPYQLQTVSAWLESLIYS